MTALRPFPLPTAAALAALALGAAAAPAAAAPGCSPLPLAVSLPSSDPTVLRDDPMAVVRARRGATVSDVRVRLSRGGRTVATGSIAGRLAAGRIAVALRPVDGRPIGRGRYRLTATGRRAGCARRTAVARTWEMHRPSLPVRAAPLSTLTGDNDGGVRLLLRTVDREAVANVRVRLLDGSGATVAQATVPGAFRGQRMVDLPLAGPLRPGAYTLRVDGRSHGAAAVARQPLAFAPGASEAAASAPAAPSAPSAPATGLIAQHATVDWSGGAWEGRDVAGFVAPGIGYGEIVCRPDAQWIRFYPDDLGREVSMMNWTYKDWSENTEKAIREAVRTATSGRDFREGLNKFWPPEKHSTGEFDGIISDRGPFGSPAPADLAAPTTLRLTWQWDFSRQGDESCHVEATFVTQSLASALTPLARSGSIAWRGSDAAAGHDATAFAVPGLGTVSLTCQAAVNGARSLTVDTEQGATVTLREASTDSARGQALGPVSADLPNNGMLAVAFPSGARLLVSSRWKVNDPDPAQNSCFVAAQAIVP